MRPLTFLQLLVLSLAVVVATGLLLMRLFGWSLIGTVVMSALWLGVASWMIVRLHRFVSTQHGDFLNVLRDLRNSLPSGRPAATLKSERAPDTFGALADEINRLVAETGETLNDLNQRDRDLEQTKTLFQSILGTMIEGVLVLDSQGKVLYCNQAARVLLDCTSRQMEGRPVWEVIRAADLNQTIDSVLATGHDHRKEVELKRNKSVVELSATRLPLKPEPGVVVVLHDITELRQLERMRREFVSNVSHELKTPLTSIQAYADTLLDGGLEDDENSRLFLSRIVEQSDRLQQLIQDMLRLARIESQSEAFQLKPVSLARTLESCVEARQAVARSRGVDLQLRPGEPTLEVLADAGGLQTVFDNLVNNALNYTPEGGRVEVRWDVDQQQVFVEVVDSGIGISSEHQERIFERFFRVDKARSRGMGGTGLGLAIVKHLANVFGGDVEVESRLGEGSTFRVRLPIFEESVPSLRPADQEA
jgi:two-component system phosphate regulon sensor histidine kinase PhoR